MNREGQHARRLVTVLAALSVFALGGAGLVRLLDASDVRPGEVSLPIVTSSSILISPCGPPPLLS